MKSKGSKEFTKYFVRLTDYIKMYKGEQYQVQADAIGISRDDMKNARHGKRSVDPNWVDALHEKYDVNRKAVMQNVAPELYDLKTLEAENKNKDRVIQTLEQKLKKKEEEKDNLLRLLSKALDK